MVIFGHLILSLKFNKMYKNLIRIGRFVKALLHAFSELASFFWMFYGPNLVIDF